MSQSLNLVIGSFGLIFNLLIISVIIYDTIISYRKTKNMHNKSDSEKDGQKLLCCINSKLLNKVTQICAISYLLHSICITIRRLNIYNSVHQCYIAQYVSMQFIYLSKFSLWLILILRIDVSFGGTIYQYSGKYVIYPICIWLCFSFLFFSQFTIMAIINAEDTISMQKIIQYIDAKHLCITKNFAWI